MYSGGGGVEEEGERIKKNVKWRWRRRSREAEEEE